MISIERFSERTDLFTGMFTLKIALRTSPGGALNYRIDDNAKHFRCGAERYTYVCVNFWNAAEKQHLAVLT